ncbi:Uncharacterised protein [Legionella birminghamensis]|uniref:Uncharacterized protein n=1 Tax=Legionella birminghamensis TaxID=28083 RepID=A0A378I831_9GAMM|nr:Uncharacterised protein [Legionella birminghamensis]
MLWLYACLHTSTQLPTYRALGAVTMEIMLR